MRDFNFFSPYIEVKKTSKFKWANILIIVFPIILLLSGITLWNMMRITALKQEVAFMKQYLSNKDTVQKLKKYEEVKATLKIQTEYYSILQDINSQIDGADIINTELLKKISDNMPKGTFFQKLSIVSDSLQIEGVADSRTAVAELTHNLKESGLFSTVHVSNIDRESELTANFRFVMICKPGDELKNEIK